MNEKPFLYRFIKPHGVIDTVAGQLLEWVFFGLFFAFIFVYGKLFVHDEPSSDLPKQQ